MKREKEKNLKILLTNDDGIESEGLYALYQELQDTAEVTVVAPKGERSAFGHAITLSDPLRVELVQKGGQLYGHAVSGTPVDCVKLGVGVILKSQPDLVISGINWGLNTGVHIFYSGTVSAALEAAILGIPAIAVSLAPIGPPVYTHTAQFIKKLASLVLRRNLPPGTLLNVNMPPPELDDAPEVAITRQANCCLKDNFQERIDPRNRTYYWLDSEEIHIVEGGDGEHMEGDIEAVQKGKISITPIRLDLTDHQLIRFLQTWPIAGLKKNEEYQT
ncbi:MAG: 5'/3'-nucleotidase SurE [bacterium]